MRQFRKLFLPLILAASLPAFATGDYTVQVNTESTLSITRVIDRSTETLKVVKAPPGENLSEAMVTFYKDGRLLLVASVAAPSEGMVDVAGTIVGMAYSHHAELESPEGAYHATYVMGTNQVDFTVEATGPDELTAREFMHFKTRVPPQQSEATATMNSFLVGASELAVVNERLLSAGELAVKGMGQPLSVFPAGAIQDYYDCVKAACEESGLCWNPQRTIACDRCPGQPLWEVLSAAVLYELAATTCILTTPVCRVLPC